ncbi:MAG: putative lipid II flippase FtsW [Lentisphaerales bacterium]|jgi:cell division protein FtsW|nr:MAG: putative lipid II flippase FtsW [Lentisphaerales bacterium]
MWKIQSILIAIVLALLALGIVMLASTSSVKGDSKHDDPQYYVNRQIVWLGVALVAGLLSAFVIDYHWWRKAAIPLSLFSIILLALVFVPHVGLKVSGASRWIRLGSFRIGQPSELAKLASVVMLASWMTHAGSRASRLMEGLIYPLSGLGVILVLVMLEPDFGTTLLIGLVGMGVMFVGGSRISHLVVAGTLGVAAFTLRLMQNAERMRRIVAFITPEAFPEDAYHLRQSLNAFILGGKWGVGLDNSLQKHFYLPEAHTDFILAIIGEELGVVATVLVVGLFVGLMVCGMIISLRSNDMFGRLLGFGVSISIGLQAAINVGVVTGCLPTKGLPLPFISAGGSSLVISLVSVGILMNIARHISGEVTDKHSRAIKDMTHWA